MMLNLILPKASERIIPQCLPSMHGDALLATLRDLRVADGRHTFVRQPNHCAFMIDDIREF